MEYGMEYGTIDNREGEGGLETRIRTYGDVTDDVPFGYRPHIRKFRDTILPYRTYCNLGAGKKIIPTSFGA